MNVLDRIIAGTREDVRRRRTEVPLAMLERALAARGDDRPFSEALTLPGVSVIAEHKRRSTDVGLIREGGPVGDVGGGYERGGAAALSILTEERNFGGSLDDLRAARAASSLPILRKDFIVDAYQLYESAAAGADAILLIVAALEPEELADLFAEAARLDLDVLVEVHDEAELETALEVIDADVIGINNRDLADFSVDVERTFELLHDIPAGKTVVSESGFHSRSQLDDLERVGVDGVLVGESLMRADDPEAALRALTGVEARVRCPGRSPRFSRLCSAAPSSLPCSCSPAPATATAARRRSSSRPPATTPTLRRTRSRRGRSTAATRRAWSSCARPSAWPGGRRPRRGRGSSSAAAARSSRTPMSSATRRR